MKKCPKCGNENTDAMSFCLQCGTALAEADPTVWIPGDQTTESLKVSPPTVTGPSIETRYFRQEIKIPTIDQRAVPPGSEKNGKSVYVIVGVVAVVFLFLLVGIAGVGGYFLYSRQELANGSTPSPKPSGSPRVTPSASPGVSPSPSPNASPTPQPSFTPPTEATKKGTFTVYANGGWQLSDIDTVPLEEFRTTIDGKIDVGGVKVGVTAGGVNDAASKSRRIYPEFPTGALLFRTRYADGKFSNVMAIAARGSNGNWRNFPDERGKIEFCINDNSPGQNGGQFTVTKTSTRIPAAKK